MSIKQTQTDKLRKLNDRCLYYWKLANSETTPPELKKAAHFNWAKTWGEVKALSKKVK